MDNLVDLIGSQANVSVSSVIIALLLSFVLGVIIAFVYKRVNRGFSYEIAFAFALVLVTVIVTSIMITIGSNVALSLGLIGALSIIRFRTAVKSSLDMAFLFWSIAVGLALGANNYPVALTTIVVVSAFIIFLDRIKIFSHVNTDYVMVVQFTSKMEDLQEQITKIFSDSNLKWKIKSSFLDSAFQEMTFSIYSHKNLDMATVTSQINALEGVKKTSLLAPDSNLYI